MLLIEVKCIFSRICHKICLQLRLRQRGPISLFGSIFYLNFNFKIIINMLNFIFFRSKYLTIMLPRISAFICVQNKLKYFHSPNWILAHFAAILAHCAAERFWWNWVGQSRKSWWVGGRRLRHFFFFGLPIFSTCPTSVVTRGKKKKKRNAKSVENILCAMHGCLQAVCSLITVQ